MVTSVSSPQIPAANTFKPGGTDENRQARETQEQSRKEQVTSVQETRRSERGEETRAASSSRSEDTGTSARSARGSLVDLTV